MLLYLFVSLAQVAACPLTHLCCSWGYLSPWRGSSSCAASLSESCRCRWSTGGRGRRPWLPARRSWVEGGSPVPAPASRSGAGSRPGCPSCRSGHPWSGSCCRWCRWSSSGDTRSRALSSPSLKLIFRGGSARTSARRTFWNRHIVKTPPKYFQFNKFINKWRADIRNKRILKSYSTENCVNT